MAAQSCGGIMRSSDRSGVVLKEDFLTVKKLPEIGGGSEKRSVPNLGENLE